MMIADSGVSLDFPSDWKHFTDSGRIVFQSSRREEVVVSARRLVSVKGSDSSVILARMIEDGCEAARKVAAVPNLRVTKALSEEVHSTLRCWTMFAETFARDVFFGQAIFAHEHGTVFLTYEAPWVTNADQSFRGALRLVRMT